MPDVTGPPYVSLAAGAAPRVESSLRESAQLIWYGLSSVDAGPLNLGATITGAQTTQNNGYQIQAANTWFATVAAGGACVLPQTNRPTPLSGLLIFIANTDANSINCYPHPNDAGNSINGQAANAPVILAPLTTTPFQCMTPGIWFADGIGTGYAGSLETIVSQGNAATAGNNAASATPITQNSVNFNSVGSGSAPTTGGVLMAAKIGLQVAVANNTSGTITAYPLGTDTINGVNAGVTIANASITLFFCFSNGAWLTK